MWGEEGGGGGGGGCASLQCIHGGGASHTNTKITLAAAWDETRENTELEYPFLKLLSFVFLFSVFLVHVSRALTKTVPPECGGEGEDGGGGGGAGSPK